MNSNIEPQHLDVLETKKNLVLAVACKHCGSLCPPQNDFCCSACEFLNKIEVKDWTPNVESNFEYLVKSHQYMDHPEFKNYYAQLDGTSASFLFFVEGLQCSSCVHLIEKLPEFDSEILLAEVNFGLSTLWVKGTESLSLSRIVSILDEWGYKSWPLSPKDNILDKYKEENRRYLKRLAVAGASAGNIMLFVIPIYAGLSGSYATLFNWLSFFIFLPIVFYSAIPFYQGALNSLKYRVINVDLPITLALLMSFIFSTINLLRGSGEIYYDSTASFIFLILSTRFLVKRLQQRTLSESSLSQYLPLQSVKLKTKTGYDVISSHQIKNHQVLLLEPHQIVPADGRIYSVSADIDMSLLNGESLTQTFTHGMKIFAGTRIVNKPVEMIVDTIGVDTEIGHILTGLEKDSLKKTQFITLTDRISQWLIAVVFSLALIFFFIYGSSTQNFQEAFNRALALIVIACPCALAFGTPLTYALALRSARQKGILIKNGDVFERFSKIKTIFFDKTGTLTSGKLSIIQNFPQDVSDEWKKIILGLESESLHPLAFAFRDAWKDITPVSISELNEILGKGVYGFYQGKKYSLESAQKIEENGLMSVVFKQADQALVYFYFSEEIHPSTQNVVHKLNKLGYTIGILSGDRKIIVDRVVRQIDHGIDRGIDKNFVFSELSPTNKKQKIESLPNEVCMIGDGANDSLAMKSSLLGVAVKGSMSLSLKSCDVILTQPGLESLLLLRDLSQKTRQTLIRNLSFALLYNLIGGVLSLMGFVNPLLAAILMPVSSGLILLSTFYGVRS